MKLVSFQSSDGPKLGASIDDKVLDLQATYQAAVTDDALPALLSGMIAFLEGGQRAFDAATHAINVAAEDSEKAVWSTDPLLSPIPNPKKLLLLAGNYASHIEEGGEVALSRSETTPRVFMKTADYYHSRYRGTDYHPTQRRFYRLGSRDWHRHRQTRQIHLR